VRGGAALALELGFREPQRFNLANAIGVGRCGAAAPAALGFPLFHLFLNSRVRVDEAFSGITHIRCVLTC
jgi:hypothetical protein